MTNQKHVYLGGVTGMRMVTGIRDYTSLGVIGDYFSFTNSSSPAGPIQRSFVNLNASVGMSFVKKHIATSLSSNYLHLEIESEMGSKRNPSFITGMVNPNAGHQEKQEKNRVQWTFFYCELYVLEVLLLVR